MPDTRSQRIANTQQAIREAQWAGEHHIALALVSSLNQLIAEGLEAGD